MTWERFWMFGSAVLLVAAAVMLWRNNLSAAFVIAALGACAWFVSYRCRLRRQFPDDEDSSEEVSTGSGSDGLAEVGNGSERDGANNQDEL